VKTISITIDQVLLRAVDRAAKNGTRTRSDICPLALKAWLARARHAERVRQEHEAYATHPVEPDEFGGLIAAQAFEDDERGEPRMGARSGCSGSRHPTRNGRCFC
jgi:predicted transcriptional regulator